MCRASFTPCIPLFKLICGALCFYEMKQTRGEEDLCCLLFWRYLTGPKIDEVEII